MVTKKLYLITSSQIQRERGKDASIQQVVFDLLYSPADSGFLNHRVLLTDGRGGAELSDSLSDGLGRFGKRPGCGKNRCFSIRDLRCSA